MQAPNASRSTRSASSGFSAARSRISTPRRRLGSRARSPASAEDVCGGPGGPRFPARPRPATFSACRTGFEAERASTLSG
jgi:hypothetical protein